MSRFQLGQIKQVVEQAEQPVAAVVNVREIFLELLRAGTAAAGLSELGKREDAVHRCAQFV